VKNLKHIIDGEEVRYFVDNKMYHGGTGGISTGFIKSYYNKKCKYCGELLILDSKQQCKNCGAEE